ncbi:MAG TPA: hypothetical protein VLM40_17575 [Gemmata sp.]|nr:hypothetical protein [Gemmata sp.]
MPPISEWWLFIRSNTFDADWLAEDLEDEDMVRLETVLVEDPLAGDVIRGTGGLRKLRFARSGMGKSGSVRVCYAFLPDHGIVLLPLVYGKSSKKDLTPAEKKYFKYLLEQFRTALDAKR